MNVLFIGKRFYTNRDALRERYGRIYQLPRIWTLMGLETRLWLIDYHTREVATLTNPEMSVVSTPALSFETIRQTWREARANTSSTTTRVVVASGDCYIGLLAYGLARHLGARLVFDVYDKYDEFPTYRKLPGFDPFSFLLRNADICLFASSALMAKTVSRSKPSFLVPNGVDPERFHDLDRLDSRRTLKLPEEAIFIGYFGSMEADRGVDDLLTAVQLLQLKGLSVEVLLAGKLRHDLQIAKPGVRYLGNVPFEQMPILQASCDLIAVPYRRSMFMDSGASNKIAEAIASARPLVVTRTPNFTENFLHQAKQLDGLIAEPGNAADIARVVEAQLAHRVIVDPPVAMDWPSIASRAAADIGLAEALHVGVLPGCCP